MLWPWAILLQKLFITTWAQRVERVFEQADNFKLFRLVDILQNWMGVRCPQPSSSESHAWCSGRACGFQGRSGRDVSRCPSWSTGPSHPGHHYRNGRHMPAAQILSTNNIRFIVLWWSLRFGKMNWIEYRMGVYTVLMLPFLSPKSAVSSFTTPSVKVIELQTML